MKPKHYGRLSRASKSACAALFCGISLFTGMQVRAANNDALPGGINADDATLIDKLNKRLDAQDAVIAELKAKLADKKPDAAALTIAPLSQTADSTSQRLDKQEADIKELRQKQDDAAIVLGNVAAASDTFPTLQFHVFGDIDYHTNNLKSDHNAFSLGEFDVFLSSQIAPDLGILTETVLSAESDDHYAIEMERLLIQWHQSEYLNVDVGRYHTQVGYYNTAYHHGTWFQTATGRPLPLNFEDSGGVIPAHNVGISVHGSVPGLEKCPMLSTLGLTYYVEVGNGRQYQSPTTTNNPVGNIFDNNDYKATNIAFTARPEWLPGLQFGAGFYHDTLSNSGFTRSDEVMIHAHLVYKNAEWEFLSEGWAIRHQPRAMLDAWSSIGFVQIARKCGAFTPYGRFTYFNAADSDPVWQYIGQPGRHFGPAVGLRYDFSTYLALKAQYDYVVNTGPGFDLGPTYFHVDKGSYSQLELQAAFTF